jgi:hypothetical protein
LVRGVGLAEEREEVEQVVRGLVVVAVLPHGHRAHLGHFVDLLPVPAHVERARGVEHLVQLPQQVRL